MVLLTFIYNFDYLNEFINNKIDGFTAVGNYFLKNI